MFPELSKIPIIATHRINEGKAVEKTPLMRMLHTLQRQRCRNNPSGVSSTL
jgi:hypothetical protein